MLVKPASDRHSERGFTLLELLVALGVLAISLTTLLAIFSQGLARTSDAQRRMEARLLAETLLAGAGIEAPLEIGSSIGETEAGLAWTVAVEPYGSPEDQDSWDYGAVMVSANVHWQHNDVDREVSLRTIRLVSKGQLP